MKRFTSIKEGNDITQFNYASEVKHLNAADAIVIDDQGNIAVNKGNPITWPTDATSGLQAIVDIKAGTLRFGMNNGPISWDEFVVSEYVEPVMSVPHIFDCVDNWPQQHRQCLCPMPLPEDWEWRWVNDDWVLTNGHVDLKREDWFKYQDNKVAAQPAQPQVTAASMLTAALGHMEDRAKTYDAPGGERSMGKTVAAFNIITGLELTEEQGWLFMEILKQVRSQQGNYRADNYEDMVAYAALRGECAARERGNK